MSGNEINRVIVVRIKKQKTINNFTFVINFYFFFNFMSNN